MDKGDRPVSGGDSGERTDPDDEEVNSDDREADNVEEPDNQRSDAGPERNPGIEPERNVNRAPDNRNTGSKSGDSATTDTSDKAGEAESKASEWGLETEADSHAGSPETDETGIEEQSVKATERDDIPESHRSGDTVRVSSNTGSEESHSDDKIYSPNDHSSDDRESLPHRFRHDKEGALMWIREMLSSVAIVLVLGLLLFGLSGVWPPMVAVESPSMEPNMNTGDLVFITEPGRFAPDAAGNDIGVVPYEEGVEADYRTFGSYGSVVIFQPPGRTASPIIHRAMFHVEDGENWYERADSQYHSAADCGELRHCPAPHDGFITLGDNNGRYDQASGLAAPVQAEWVTGVARVRVPYLGYIRLIATGQAEIGDVVATTGGTGVNGGNAVVSGGTSDSVPNRASGYETGNYEAVGTSDYEAVGTSDYEAVGTSDYEAAS